MDGHLKGLHPGLILNLKDDHKVCLQPVLYAECGARLKQNDNADHNQDYQNHHHPTPKYWTSDDNGWKNMTIVTMMTMDGWMGPTSELK